MSKAKELATKIRRYIDRRHTSWYFGGVRHELYELLEIILADDAVLSEPDKPDAVKGWIEVGEKPYRKLISTTTERIYREGSYRHNGSGFQSNPNEIHMLLDGGKDYENLEISFDDFKAKIKEAG